MSMGREDRPEGLSFRRKVVWALGAWLLGILILSGLYFGIVSLAESPRHAVELFWQDRRLILPIIFGFGVQTSLNIILRKRLYITFPATLSANPRATGAVAGASGSASTDGKPILQGAKKLSLTVQNVDAPQRVFTLDLP